MTTVFKVITFPIFVVSLYLYRLLDFPKQFVVWWKKL